LKTDLQSSKRTSARSKARFAPRSLALCLVVTLFPLSPLQHSQQALAQSSNSTQQRIVDGRVDDKAGAAIPGAVVYLKDIKTLTVKSFICAADGKFHFGQLSQNADYELWAELNGKHSKTKRISSFASQNNFNFSLVLDE
jgi:hypothetical protein